MRTAPLPLMDGARLEPASRCRVECDEPNRHEERRPATSTITIQDAQAILPELVRRLAPGEGVIITEGDRPIARMISVPTEDAPRPVPGRCRGMLVILAEDDEHLEDFAEYMP
ncbi:hypothetical protein OJF2_42660 [Aquisphaera giovannonii]|uniref:Antitoxin n=1 Tax=Aquisphaera giovannonii TaxID=406548 RepID=A0A5B9W6C4_9BACT|nr:hypothetical protein [Aquisphaera giovannonii]QEH35709.1 hypothetical protein OJF2_42660 [Aquisphaera giovannonii]